MKRIIYVLVDDGGRVQARMTIPEGESVPLEPWMAHGVNRMGWRLTAVASDESGVVAHGWADWRAVADNMATVLGIMLSEDFDFSDEAMLEDVLTHARNVVDDYHVAEMEVGIAEVDAVVEEQPEEGNGGND